MNKKEVLEIRKQFKPENCTISRIRGCYVDHEKNKVLESVDAFLSLPEEEMHKYFEIFKKTLSGTIGKNLVNMEFPLASEKEGGTQKFLYDLKSSKLTDDMLVEEFYDKVIETYSYDCNYYIILIHAIYDVPGRTSDGLDMDDASDRIYDYMLCAICPVNLSKGGLSYDAMTNSICERVRDWIVEEPINGFLFPAFDDRDANIHATLYYSKKPEELQLSFVENLLGTVAPLTASTQKEVFNSVVEEILGEDCSLETVKNIHDNLNVMLAENKDNPDIIELGKNEVKHLLESSGIKSDKLEDFDNTFEESAGPDTTFVATNVVNAKKFAVKTPEVEIKINSDRTDIIDTMVIDNRKCLVIKVDDDVMVNGVNIRMNNSNEEEYGAE